MMFAGFFVFFIANIVLVIWALVDAIRVPDDLMYRAGNKLDLDPGDPAGRFHRRDRLLLRRTAGRRRRSFSDGSGARATAASAARVARLAPRPRAGAWRVSAARLCCMTTS